MESNWSWRRGVYALGVAAILTAGVALTAQNRRPGQGLQEKGQAHRGFQAAAHAVTVNTSVAEAYGKLPLSFEKNEGQTDNSVKYLSRAQGYNLFLTPTGAVLALQVPAKKENAPDPQMNQLREATAVSQTVVSLRLLDANPKLSIAGQNLLAGKSNYFIGNDPSKWRTNVAQYSQVRYRNVYPGIDLVYYGNQRQLEFDLVVAPGGDPRQVRFKLAGAKKIELTADGNLVVHARGGDLSLQKPVIYQTTPQGKKSIDGRYVLAANQEVTFETGAYNKSEPLVVDPTLVYATYIGGTGSDSAVGIAVDASGNAYIGGNTSSTDFPTANPFQTSGNMFVTKLNATGSALIYSSYFGGPTSGFNSLNALAIDTAGNAYLTGSAGTSFPIVNQISGACDLSCQNGSGAFVAKIDAAGATLLYSSRVGIGSNGEAIAVDSAGSAYVSGQASNPDFPIVSAFQPTLGGGEDAFLLKVDAQGSALIYSTFLGGSASDVATGVAVDSSGNAYVAGTTNSPNFPTSNQIPGACVGTCGTGANQDVFVSKFSSDGSALTYSSLLGGSGEDVAAPPTSLVGGTDFGHSIVVDSNGNAYVGGATSPVGNFVLTNPATPNDFPTTPGAFQTTPNCANTCVDGFVTKINAAGNALSFSTFFGTTPSHVNGLAVDSSGDVAALGLFVIPFVNPVYQNGGNATAVGVLNPAGSSLLFSTTQGLASGGTFDSQGNLYVAGFTCGNGIAATNGAFQTTCNSTGTGSNAFVSKISLSGSSTPVVSFTPGSLTFASQNVGTSSAGQNVTLTNSGTVALDITGISITGTDAGDYSETNTCGATLAAAANCSISVTFKPTAAGTRTASVSVADNATGSPQTVPLTGTGTAATAPAVTLAPASLTFSSQTVGTASSAQSITLTNSGNATLNVTGVTLAGTNAGDYSETNTCGATLAASANCTISVTFKPTASGARTASVSIADNASGSPQTVPLSGTAVAAPAPAVTFAPTSLTFASQLVASSSAAQSITLTNSGNAALSITGVTITGTNAGDYSETNTCGATLAASANCAISVTFKPTASGTRTATVSITDNASGSPQTVALSGTAVAPDFSLAASPAALSVTAGQSGTATIAVTPSNGFNQAVSFSCSGLPTGASCSFSPRTVTPSGAAASTTLTISTSTSSAFLPQGIRFRPARFPTDALFALLLVLLAFLRATSAPYPRLQRRWVSATAGVLLLASIGLMTGCGSGSKVKAPINATVTITGTSGSGAGATTHSATITLTVTS